MTFKLRPKELKNPLYYLHLVILELVALGLLEVYSVLNNYPDWTMLNIHNLIWSFFVLLAGDIIAHTLLRMD